MKGFCPLASGSKGNCLFLGTSKTKILIDAGLSTKMTQAKLQEIGVSLDEIDAVLVSHDHGDHIHGLRVMTSRYNIPILANAETAKGIATYFAECPPFKIFSTGETFHFEDLEIHPFSVPHDTLDPVAFTIKCEGVKLGICTDLGYVTALVRNQLKECDFLYLEANHEPSMVHASSRPMVYKQRVLGKTGHLSNHDCAKLLVEISHPELKHVHLAHLSSECNSPETALSTIHEILNEHGITLDLCVAPQHMVSKPIFF